MELADQDTIVAIATPPGEGGIGVIRLSGVEAENLLLQHFQPGMPGESLQSHKLYYGKIVGAEGEMIDEVLAVVMRSPRSYTREDVVEIQCHGGRVVQTRILHLLVDSGARLARPGEFTLRAFLNGRIDLAEAEAVIDLIRSRSEAAFHVALGQMTGKLSKKIHQYRDQLGYLLGEVEAGIDFPEEDLETEEGQELYDRGTLLLADMESVLATFESGRVLKEGLGILIFGKPNVGKSSLMNGLLGEARTIVTEIPGTTRDTIEESLVLGGIPLRLVDTAGVRETVDPVEAEGVKRARGKLSQSDLVLLVIDGSGPLDQDDFFALDACKERRVLLIVNKKDLGVVDLVPPFAQLPKIHVSTLVGDGLDQIEAYISKIFGGGSGADVRESVALSDARHREALVRGKQALERFLLGLKAQTAPELLAVEIRDALDAIGEITGETTPASILENIFSRFCIGK
ncbi:MAG: tRNA uridine-5-carboxymethylaminomethyl(34) synthesis GTPase MnmE [Syntrophotaleaceae bacterium]